MKDTFEERTTVDCGLWISDCGLENENPQSAIGNPQSAIRNPKSEIRNRIRRGCGRLWDPTAALH